MQTSKIKKPLQYFAYKNNKKAWLNAIQSLKSGDLVVVQYPLVDTAYDFEEVLAAARSKGIRTVALIHDMDSLRYNETNATERVVKRVNKEDKTLLPLFDAVICHNPSMEKVLCDYGCSNLVSLELFDYLCPEPESRKDGSEKILIAGNLDSAKAGYLKQLKNVNWDFNLYGVGWNPQDQAGNIHYQGKFPPEQLPEILHGKFGLVWDGDSLEDCKGGYGGYLYYNNPHKTSLYLASGIPVIARIGTAIGQFVDKNQVGLTVESLMDLPAVLNGLDDEAYQHIVNNVCAVGDKARQGGFLKEAFRKAERIINESDQR